MPIYTRTGDKGQTSLFDGTRVSKSHVRVDTYGTIDELNSQIGAAIAEISSIKNQGSQISSNSYNGQVSIKKISNELENIQQDLLDIGSTLAMPGAMPVLGLDNRVKDFETLIDTLTAKMPELKNFILPGGSKAGSLLHVARTVTRRAERRLITLIQEEDIDEEIIKYINRLSDLLFTIARFVNFIEKKKETIWIKK